MQDVAKHLEADGQASESDVLRAAAIVKQRHIYVFDLDSEQPTCDVYPLLPQDHFKVLLPKPQGKKQADVVIDQPAWSLTLGRDTLPQQLLLPRSYFTHNLIVLSKHNGSFSAYRERDNFTGSAQLSEPLHEKLGLQFQPVRFEAAKGKKRANAGDDSRLANVLFAVTYPSMSCSFLPCIFTLLFLYADRGAQFVA